MEVVPAALLEKGSSQERGIRVSADLEREGREAQKWAKDADRRRELNEVQRIGFALANRREREGLSRGELARAVGTSAAHLAKIERGEVNPRLGLVLRLGSALGWVIR